MKRIFNKIITGFFIVILGIAWYITRYQIKPEFHNIIIYDVFGNQIKIDEIRTRFKTCKVAQSYVLEYQKRFPHYEFSIASKTPDIKDRKILGIFKIYR